MSVEAHIQQLQQRHRGLEEQLNTLSNSPSTTDTELVKLKQEKLRLKDEISRLSS